MNIKKLKLIKSKLCNKLPLDVGLNCFNIDGEGEDGKPIKGAQFVLQQVLNYETLEMKRTSYLVTDIELNISDYTIIVSKIFLEWENDKSQD